MSAQFKASDGGRADAGFRGHTGDCVTRSIAIATDTPYREVYDALNELAKTERKTKRMRRGSSARTGVYRKTYERYLIALGWTWTPTMQIGSGCTTHLTANELPAGRLIVAVSRHITTMIDGVVHDTHDPSRDGRRCVYGYYRQQESQP